jgi:hypothetical protein
MADWAEADLPVGSLQAQRLPQRSDRFGEGHAQLGGGMADPGGGLRVGADHQGVRGRRPRDQQP